MIIGTHALVNASGTSSRNGEFLLPEWARSTKTYACHACFAIQHRSKSNARPAIQRGIVRGRSCYLARQLDALIQFP